MDERPLIRRKITDVIDSEFTNINEQPDNSTTESKNKTEDSEETRTQDMIRDYEQILEQYKMNETRLNSMLTDIRTAYEKENKSLRRENERYRTIIKVLYE